MFEDFSFSSPSSSRPTRLALEREPDDRLMVDPDSALISPLSSRCPSPRSSSSHRFPRNLPRSRSSYFRSPPPTSVPSSAYDHKRLSISTLTRKLHEHTIHNRTTGDDQQQSPISPVSPNTLPGYFLTPPPDPDHEDEGFFDSPPSLLTSPSLSPQQPPSPFLSPTSVPSDLFFHGNASAEDQAQDPAAAAAGSWNVRAHRQNIARLQCNPSDVDAIRRALLSDDDSLKFKNPFRDGEVDCHPSSLPPQVSPRRRAATLSHRGRYRPQTGSGLADAASSDAQVLPVRTRRRSSAGQALHGSASARIEKSYQHSSARVPRKKSEQGLRRKSLVSAALASMVENAP